MQKCRSLLGADCKLTDAELEQLRQEMYAYAGIALESFRASKMPGVVSGVQSCLEAVPEPEREAVAERAAILEYEANLTKPEAERQAFGEWVQSKKPARNKARMKAGRKASRKPKPLDFQSGDMR